METFKCVACQRVLDITEFPKRKNKRGYRLKCRACMREYDRNWRASNADKVLAKSRKYHENNINKAREQNREYSENNREQIRARSKKNYWDKRQERLKHHKEYYNQNKHKKRAHGIVKSMVKAGKIKKPTICSICKKTGKLHAHHDDYYKPLNIIWVCSACHGFIHRKTA